MAPRICLVKRPAVLSSVQKVILSSEPKNSNAKKANGLEALERANPIMKSIMKMILIITMKLTTMKMTRRTRTKKKKPLLLMALHVLILK